MDIQHLLGRLEAILLEAKKVPGTKMRLVDVDRCFQLIDQMVLAIPEEIKKAQRITQEHDRIVAQAKEEADHIRNLAREEASRLADDAAVIQIATTRAGAIEERARREADRMREEADHYALDTLRRLKEELEHAIDVVGNGVVKLETDITTRIQLANPEEAAEPVEAEVETVTPAT